MLYDVGIAFFIGMLATSFVSWAVRKRGEIERVVMALIVTNGLLAAMLATLLLFR